METSIAIITIVTLFLLLLLLFSLHPVVFVGLHYLCYDRWVVKS